MNELKLKEEIKKLGLFPLLKGIFLIIVAFYIVNLMFGLAGTIILMIILVLYRIYNIYKKGKDKLKSYITTGFSIIYFVGIIYTRMNNNKLGFYSLLIPFLLLLVFKLWIVLSKWSSIKKYVLSVWIMFEKIQLGRDLDDPYWITHKKPTWKELLTGRYVPKDLNGNEVKE